MKIRKQYLLYGSLFILISTHISCVDDKQKGIQATKIEDTKLYLGCPEYIKKGKDKNLNISILLDLSDRIEKGKIKKKDSAYLSSLAKSFVAHIKTKKLILLEDRMQLFFNPEPSSDKVNEIAKKLKVNFTKDTDKELLNETLSFYTKYPSQLYNLAKKDADKNGDYSGSDIWRFFKNNVKDYCIDDCHRNILVIFTDGYIYHELTVMEDKNRTSYLTPVSLNKLGLNNSNWMSTIKKKNLGFIPATANLQDLEVLVIGIHSENDSNPYAQDIIQYYWSNWLKEMGVKEENYKIKNAGIPANIEKVIFDFILK